MGDMQQEIYIGKDGWSTSQKDDFNKKYIRTDIHEAELTKLRNALDAAYRALKGAEAMDNTLNNGLLNFTLDNVNWYNSAIVTSNIKKALYEIKQAKGEA